MLWPFATYHSHAQHVATICCMVTAKAQHVAHAMCPVADLRVCLHLVLFLPHKGSQHILKGSRYKLPHLVTAAAAGHAAASAGHTALMIGVCTCLVGQA